jgi:hypothetical protein
VLCLVGLELVLVLINGLGKELAHVKH